MDSLNAIKAQQRELQKLERNLSKLKVMTRKQDARRKIELGGLVVKARMNSFPKAVILGALIDAFENLERDESFRMLLQSKGEAAFMGYALANDVRSKDRDESPNGSLQWNK